MIELHLKLSRRAAEALLAGLGFIGGSPEGPRGVITAITSALCVALGITDIQREVYHKYLGDRPGYLVNHWPNEGPDIVCTVQEVDPEYEGPHPLPGEANNLPY